MGQESLTRFDQPKKSKNKNRSKNKVSNQNPRKEQGQNSNPTNKKPFIIKKNENKD